MKSLTYRLLLLLSANGTNPLIGTKIVFFFTGDYKTMANVVFLLLLAAVIARGQLDDNRMPVVPNRPEEPDVPYSDVSITPRIIDSPMRLLVSRGCEKGFKKDPYGNCRKIFG